MDDELRNMFNERKAYSEAMTELNAPDPIRELLSLPNPARQRIIEWHNRYFGQLHVERSSPENDYSAPRITIDGRLASQQGSGSRAVLSVLCALLHPSRSVLLIDEPEIGVEPQVQKRLVELIRKVARGEDGLPRKRILIATHSHIFLDKETLGNNWIVTKNAEGTAMLSQVKSREELHTLIYRLLGNSPEDLLFPDNILVVEGPSDSIFWRRVLGLMGAGGIAVHFSDGDSGVGPATAAIDQMLKTQAYIPWYRDRLCIAVDGDVAKGMIDGWRKFLKDDGTRVHQLSQKGIEFYYPASVVSALSGVPVAEVPEAVAAFVAAMGKGARTAALGTFMGSKRDLATAVANSLEAAHLSELSPELVQVGEVVRARRFSTGK